MYEIELFNNDDKFIITETENNRRCVSDITSRISVEGISHITYSKSLGNVDKAKKRLVNHLIKESKEDYNIAKTKYNKYKQIKQLMKL